MVPTARPLSPANVRVALLTNSLSPHTLPLCEGISCQIRELRAFVSAASDTFHDFPRPQASFQIVVQRSFNALRLRHRTQSFSISEQIHLPLDTLPQLFRYGPDVILSGQFGARTLFAIMYRMLRPQVRVILWAALSSHTEGKRSGLRHALRRWMLRHVDGVFINGKSGERYVRSLEYTGPTYTIPYTIDPSLFESTSFQPGPDEMRLLFCGRVDKTKGILRFCRVLHRWCKDHPGRRVRMQIIGDGPDGTAIEALPKLVNLTFELLPRMGQEELAAHYKQADLFAFPSMLDEWGVVVNEAMSAGLPVLGSVYSQSAVELISDGANGWLFDPQRPNSTYATLNRALATPVEELDCMSAYARCTVQEIAPERIIKRAVEAITEVCGIQSASQAPSSSEMALTRVTAIPVP